MNTLKIKLSAVEGINNSLRVLLVISSCFVFNYTYAHDPNSSLTQADSSDTGPFSHPQSSSVPTDAPHLHLNERGWLGINSLNNNLSGNVQRNWRAESPAPETVFQLNTVGTSWHSAEGNQLYIGQGWSNFTDFIGGPDPISILNNQKKSAQTQVRLDTSSGFSLSIEHPKKYKNKTDNYRSKDLNEQDFTDLILAWRGGKNQHTGHYEVAALRRDIEFDQMTIDGMHYQQKEVGWGINLAGGWEWGKIKTALRMTFGNNIGDIFNQQTSPLNKDASSYRSDAFSITPSINFDVTTSSSFHVAVGHYKTQNKLTKKEAKTLDTLYIGYKWSPWSNTRIGLEIITTNTEGVSNDKSQTKLQFGAKKSF